MATLEMWEHNIGNCWVAVRELDLNDHNPETLLFTVYLYCGNLI